jgi:ribonuclease HII
MTVNDQPNTSPLEPNIEYRAEAFDLSSVAVTSATVCGLDEAGRGPLAGPLVAAAVVFPADFEFAAHFPAVRFRDSKKLSARQREAAYTRIFEFALDVRVEVVAVADINRMGIGWANRSAFERLVMQVEADRYIVDGNLRLSNLGKKARRVTCVVNADQTEQCATAASIVAKVTRDRIMTQLHAECPLYGWDHNMGYGTAQHIAALLEHGRTAHHRERFVTTALARTQRLPGFSDTLPPRESTVSEEKPLS